MGHGQRRMHQSLPTALSADVPSVIDVTSLPQLSRSS